MSDPVLMRRGALYKHLATRQRFVLDVEIDEEISIQVSCKKPFPPFSPNHVLFQNYETQFVIMYDHYAPRGTRPMTWTCVQDLVRFKPLSKLFQKDKWGDWERVIGYQLPQNNKQHVPIYSMFKFSNIGK